MNASINKWNVYIYTDGINTAYVELRHKEHPNFYENLTAQEAVLLGHALTMYGRYAEANNEAITLRGTR